MKNQKWVIVPIVLVLIVGTAGALTWLRAHQKLGQPGIKAAPVPGTARMRIDLPELVLDYTSTNMPESEVELSYFPPDTSYVRRIYRDPDGFSVSGTVILMGSDRTSIHQPKYCLPGQGWRIDQEQVVQLPISRPQPYEMPVMKWTTSGAAQTPDGRKQDVRGLYVFWFVADNEETTSDAQFQLYLFRDLLFTGVLQRWAYVSYWAECLPGQEDATFARMKRLIAASVPEFQLPPKRVSASSPQ